MAVREQIVRVEHAPATVLDPCCTMALQHRGVLVGWWGRTCGSNAAILPFDRCRRLADRLAREVALVAREVALDTWSARLQSYALAASSSEA
jgi:hypothetical protein